MVWGRIPAVAIYAFVQQQPAVNSEPAQHSLGCHGLSEQNIYLPIYVVSLRFSLLSHFLFRLLDDHRCLAITDLNAQYTLGAILITGPCHQERQSQSTNSTSTSDERRTTTYAPRCSLISSLHHPSDPRRLPVRHGLCKRDGLQHRQR